MTKSKVLGLQLFWVAGFYQEGISAVIITSLPELNQLQQHDTYNYVLYTVEMFYLKRPGQGYYSKSHDRDANFYTRSSTNIAFTYHELYILEKAGYKCINHLRRFCNIFVYSHI